MKTVGLITMHRVNNCGSFLQTYATVKSVERLGYGCQVIDYLYPTPDHVRKAEGDENKQNGRHKVLKKVLQALGVFRGIQGFRINRRLARAERVFKRFSNVSVTKPYSRSEIRRNPPKYDIYLTGSDQTWNPRYLADDRTYLLDFAPDHAKCIAYAASFGCRKLPEEVRAEYAELLARYSSISVRETSGVEIVRDLTRMQAYDVLDPTMLLTAAEWRQKAAHRYAHNGRFIFAYLLSYVFSPYPDVVDLLGKLAIDLNAKVVVYADGNAPRELEDAGFVVLRDNKHYLYPDEFLEYIDRSVFVVTTSFHGTAFSVNFRKNFYALTNPNETKDDRVKSFLSKVGLSMRGFPPCTPTVDLPALNVDYANADKAIEVLRKQSFEYLSNALEGES